MLDLFELLMITKDDQRMSDYTIAFKNQVECADTPMTTATRCNVLVVPDAVDAAAVIGIAKSLSEAKHHSGLSHVINQCISNCTYLNLDEKIEHIKLSIKLIKATIAHPNFKTPELAGPFERKVDISYFIGAAAPSISKWVTQLICNGKDILELYEAANVLVHTCFLETGLDRNTLCNFTEEVTVINDSLLTVSFSTWNSSIGNASSDMFRVIKDMEITPEHFDRYIDAVNGLFGKIK